MQNSQLPKPSNLFQGPYYNRRQLSRARQSKPQISKIPGTPTWACRFKPDQSGWVPVFGFGLTPALAYADWKEKMTQWL